MALRSPSPPKPSTDLRLLDLATEHVRRNGAARLTVTEIAVAAGMSHANVYRYFRSKTALLEAVTATWLAPLEAGLRIIADAPDPAHDKLERLLFAIHRAYRDKLVTDPKIFDLFCAATAQNAEIARRHQQRIARAIQRILDEGHGSGAYLINDQTAAANFVLDAMYRFLAPATLRADIDSPHAEIENRAARLLNLVGQALARGSL
ncbi:MAG: TetR/AcrR family transcriptional regulator [Methylovirgula sp.]|nr:TetR/AcrR family transcriptional regulator [Methylovirgula sp.]